MGVELRRLQDLQLEGAFKTREEALSEITSTPG
jgi:hypothetical protein